MIPEPDAGPMRMRAAVVDERGRLRATEAGRPEPAPGEVLVRVEACGLCGSDLHAARRARWPAGLIPGHEIAGRVEALGEGARSGGDGLALEPGQPVVLEPLVSCGRCVGCTSGRDPICPELQIAGVHRAGGFAEWISLPAGRVFGVDPTLEPSTAALVEPIAVALHAIDRAALVPGERVLVLGGGTIGLLCALAAVRAGARETVVTTRYPQQAAFARDCGARAVDLPRGVELDAERAGAGYDVVIETIGGEAETLADACRLAGPGARIVVAGLFDAAPRFDPWHALGKELGLLWTSCYVRPEGREPDFARAAALLARERTLLATLVTHRLPLDEIGRAFTIAGDKHAGVLKLSVVP